MYGDKCYVKKNENENNIKDSENGIANDVLFSRGLDHSCCFCMPSWNYFCWRIRAFISSAKFGILEW